MARSIRVEYEGAIYHVTCRMIGDGELDRSRLFVDDQDRKRFLDRLADRVEQYNVRLYLFACMSNHFHLVFETPEGNCGKFMQSLSTAYTVYYNLRHHRHGHLLDGRYKAKLVDSDDYLLALSRYVHLNPVQIGPWKDKPIKDRIAALRSYPWSSYPSYIGQRKALDFVDYAPILGQMSGKRRAWPKRYGKYVESGLAKTDEDFKVAVKISPRSIGSAGFRAWIEERYQGMIGSRHRPEDVAFRRITEPLNADGVLAALAKVFGTSVEEFSRRRRDSVLRGVAGRFLVRYAGLTQREAAEKIGGASGAALSWQMRKVSEVLENDRDLRRLVDRAEEEIGQLRKSVIKPQEPKRSS